MIKIGDKEFRNLEEQVLKNKEDIANHYNMDRVLADFGITIIGSLGDADELENVPHPDKYGDAYAVGREPPYSFFVWTRADVNAGHPEDYWLDIGKLAIAGPQGPQGPIGETGPTGQRGSLWTSRSGVPTNASMYLPGDQWLDTANGNVYAVNETDQGKAWVKTGSIRGPQGIQGERGEQGAKGEPGPQGEKGPQGEGAAIVQIIGTITNTSQLPDPESVLSNSAFLQNVDNSWHLWIIIGQPGSYQWTDTGDMTIGTLVTKNGKPVDVYDIQNVLNGPFTQYALENEDEPVTSGLVFQDAIPGATDARYFVRKPVSAMGELGVPGSLTPKIAQFDKIGRIGAIAKNLIPRMTLKAVPTEPSTEDPNIAALPLDYATPRAYVDAQIEYAGQEKVSWPEKIPYTGMLLGINPDKSVVAIDPSTIVGKPVIVDCQIVKRGGSLILPRNKMYLIRAYGENTATLRSTSGIIAANFTMAFGAVSSSNEEISDPTKTWAGFMYISNTSGVIPTINWSGNSHAIVTVVNNDTGTSGSGNLYVYSIGQSST